MKKIVFGILFLVTSIICKGQLPEVGLYMSPLGLGYSQLIYNYQNSGQVTSVKGTGFNYTPSAFLTVKLNRFRIGAEGHYTFKGITGFNRTIEENLRTDPRNTTWRHGYGLGGRLGFDIIRAPFIAISPTVGLGTFRLNHDGFGEEMTRRMYRKYSVLFEFRGPGFTSFFIEPLYMKYRYRQTGITNPPQSRMYFYNVNLGFALRI